MNGLDSLLEALALNYLSYGYVWAWVAVLTAAVSFLTIKASSTPPRGKIPDGSSPAKITAPIETTSSSSPSSKTAAFGAAEREGSTKGKLILYYHNNYDHDKWRLNKGEDNGEVNGKWPVAVEERWWDKWENLMRMRMGDDEWYRYQDLTVINGNVVKLWDVQSRKNMVVVW